MKWFIAISTFLIILGLLGTVLGGLFWSPVLSNVSSWVVVSSATPLAAFYSVVYLVLRGP